VERLQKQLMLFQETLDEWQAVQKNWMYLETIFSAPDIQRQLPEASASFNQVDKSWRQIMKNTNDNPNALKAGTVPGLRDTLKSHNAALDKIQKNLEDYLETKRASFPRFYFLSNDELLEILAQTKNVQAVQPHMSKCFDAIKKIRFSEEKREEIQGMMAPDGEYVLVCRGSSEDFAIVHVESGEEPAWSRCFRALMLPPGEIPFHSVRWVASSTSSGVVKRNNGEAVPPPPPLMLPARFDFVLTALIGCPIDSAPDHAPRNSVIVT
jgi:hypothetical protein